MTGLVESATAVMRMAERRLDVVAHNVANLSTPGYKRRVSFAEAVNTRSIQRVGADGMIDIFVRTDPAQGRLSETGNPLDLALSGAGYFKVRAGERMLYSRQGQFRRSADGVLTTPQGYVLQQAGGGDLVVDSAAISVEQDGTVFDNGRPIARIAVERSADPAGMTAVGESVFSSSEGSMDEAEGVVVRQGMSESSNVSLGDEMTQSMVAVRQAESGARLIQLYDELMGRAVSAFAGGGR